MSEFNVNLTDALKVYETLVNRDCETVAGMFPTIVVDILSSEIDLLDIYEALEARGIPLIRPPRE